MATGTAKQSLKAAVKQKPMTTRKGLMQRMFAWWFDAFVYNQIWEDPEVDIKALQLDRDSRILTISSGGCNALNYLLGNPQSITAADLNSNHIHLLNLKIAAIRFLPGHKEFFEFFGMGSSRSCSNLFEDHIRENLDAETRRFWLSRTFPGLLTGERRIDWFSRKGLYNNSRSGYFLRIFHKLAHLTGCRPEEVLMAKTREEQVDLYEKNTAPFFDSFVMKTIGSMPITLFGLGIPPQQYEELKKEFGANGSILDVYKERTRKLAVGFPIETNYFAWQAFARRYDVAKRLAIPDYLKQENFDLLRQRVSRLETEVGSVTSCISESENHTFNRFVFLDAQDWMDAAAKTELWTLIAERSEPGSRIIFRTAGKSSPVEQALPPVLRSRFEYLESESQMLFEQDRASIYGGFHLYVLR